MGVLWEVKKEERRQGVKITDILYTLTPSMDFTNEIKTANARQRDHQALLSDEKKKPPKKSLKQTLRCLFKDFIEAINPLQ